MIEKPACESIFEFLGCRAYGSAVVGVGNFPEDDAGIGGLNTAGMAYGNVAVLLSVNQEHGYARLSDGVFR